MLEIWIISSTLDRSRHVVWPINRAHMGDAALGGIVNQVAHFQAISWLKNIISGRAERSGDERDGAVPRHWGRRILGRNVSDSLHRFNNKWVTPKRHGQNKL